MNCFCHSKLYLIFLLRFVARQTFKLCGEVSMHDSVALICKTSVSIHPYGDEERWPWQPFVMIFAFPVKVSYVEKSGRKVYRLMIT